MNADVVVVGGGPTGAVSAKAAAEAGAEVLLIEKNPQIGRPVQCAGIISTRAFKQAKVSSQVSLRKIRGAFIQAPDGWRITVDGGETKAYVIDRERFDQELVSQAQASGVEVRVGVQAVGLNGNVLEVNENGTRKQVKARVIIGADGAYSRVARWRHMPAPKKILYGIQAIVPYKPVKEDFVEVLLGRKIAPNFFAWIIPSSSGFARVGLATERKELARSCLEKVLQGKKIGKVLKFQGGVIPIGLAGRTVSDGLLLVGDAAGQVKPTSGGGIYPGLICADFAGRVAAEAIMNKDTSARYLAKYENLWRRKLARELYWGMKAHNLLCRLTDSNLNQIFKALGQKHMLKKITQYGDMDYPSFLMRQSLFMPKLWSCLLPLLPRALCK